jgi:hypothetical protein
MSRSGISAILTMMAFTTVINGQYSGFNLSKYKLPDIKISRLDFNFNLSNSHTNYIEKFIYQTFQQEYKNDNKLFNGLADLNYYYFRNKEKYQGSFTVDMNYQPGFYTNMRDSSITRNNSSSADILISSVNKFFNINKYFFEIDPELSLKAHSTRYYQDLVLSMGASQDDYTNTFTKTAAVPVAIGHGRIEPVEDARLAIYILEELNKAGRISALPSDNIVLELAKAISRIKSERFFDSRLRKIKELQVIDSFLVVNNLISSHDISYFAVLNDQWDYASGPSRAAGFEVSAGINDKVTFNKDHNRSFSSGSNSSNNFIYTNTFEAGLFLSIKYAKPVNLYWQSSLSLVTSINREYTRDPKQKDNQTSNYETNIFNTDLSYSLQYLPNSRTSIALNLATSWQTSSANMKTADSEPVNLKNTGYELVFQPGIQIYYYFSPRLRCQLNPYLAIRKYNHELKSENSNPINYENYNYNEKNVTLTMIYSFF